jgi:hypothetical protein
MQAQQLHIGDEQSPVVQVREEESGNFKALIDEIWLRFTERAIEMRRSRSGIRIDASTNR